MRSFLLGGLASPLSAGLLTRAGFELGHREGPRDTGGQSSESRSSSQEESRWATHPASRCLELALLTSRMAKVQVLFSQPTWAASWGFVTVTLEGRAVLHPSPALPPFPSWPMVPLGGYQVRVARLFFTGLVVDSVRLCSVQVLLWARSLRATWLVLFLFLFSHAVHFSQTLKDPLISMFVGLFLVQQNRHTFSFFHEFLQAPTCSLWLLKALSLVGWWSLDFLHPGVYFFFSSGLAFFLGFLILT